MKFSVSILGADNSLVGKLLAAAHQKLGARQTHPATGAPIPPAAPFVAGTTDTTFADDAGSSEADTTFFDGGA